MAACGALQVPNPGAYGTLQNILRLEMDYFLLSQQALVVVNITPKRFWKGKNKTKNKHFILFFFFLIMNILTPYKDAFLLTCS